MRRGTQYRMRITGEGKNATLYFATKRDYERARNRIRSAQRRGLALRMQVNRGKWF